MSDEHIFFELPRRPAWAALAAPVGAWLTGTFVALVVGSFLQAGLGPSRVLSALALALVPLTAIFVIRRIAARSGGGEPWQLGLDGFHPASACAWAALIVLPGLAVAWLALAGADVEAVLELPSAVIGPGVPLAFGATREAVAFDAAIAASAIALCVLPAVATEFALRAIAMPALAPSIGYRASAVVTALLTPAPFALLTDARGGGPILAAALVIGLGTSFTYVRTASLYPGTSALAFALGATLGLGLAWPLAQAACLALACAALAAGSLRALAVASTTRNVAGWERVPHAPNGYLTATKP